MDIYKTITSMVPIVPIVTPILRRFLLSYIYYIIRNIFYPPEPLEPLNPLKYIHGVPIVQWLPGSSGVFLVTKYLKTVLFTYIFVITQAVMHHGILIYNNNTLLYITI